MALSDKQTNELATILEDLQPYVDQMTGQSPGFVREQTERFAKYNSRIFLSERQMDWLRTLHGKFCGTIDSKAETGGREELQPEDRDLDHPNAPRRRGPSALPGGGPRRAAPGTPKKATRKIETDPRETRGAINNSDMDDDIPF